MATSSITHSQNSTKSPHRGDPFKGRIVMVEGTGGKRNAHIEGRKVNLHLLGHGPQIQPGEYVIIQRPYCERPYSAYFESAYSEDYYVTRFK